MRQEVFDMKAPIQHPRPAADNASELVETYGPLVKRIAYHLKGRLPDSVPVDDLLQAGMLGLLEAAANFDCDGGASFETFVGIRIRGAMLDEVRRQDWAPRSVHRKSREISEAARTVENRLGREARDQEVAAELGLELEEYHRMLADSSAHRVISFDEGGDDEGSLLERLADAAPGPDDGLQQQGQRRSLVEAIKALPERERLVMSLYYDEELNLKEIGEILGISESRVCQIHGKVLSRLRSDLSDS